MNNLYYDARPCGAGKSHQEIADLVCDGGLHLYAVEKHTAMAEVEATIQRLAEKSGSRVTVKRIFSRGQVPELMSDGTLMRTGSTNVRADIEALPGSYVSGNVIVIVTHEGLKMSDLTGFTNWSLTIDETPSIWDRQRITVALPSMVEFFRSTYDLKRLTPTSSEIVIREGTDPATTKALARDDLARAASILHARVLSDRTHVTTDLMSWDDLMNAGALEWSSIWSPEQLSTFRRVHVLANDFPASVTHQIFRSQWPHLTWADLNRETTRRYAERDVLIRYYSEQEAGRGLFRTEDGQRYLRMIAMDLRAEFEPTNHIWMCNGVDEPLFRHPDPDEGWIAPGVKLSPRQQGSNKFKSISAATMIYTAKPDKRDRAIMREIGLDPQYVTDSREREIIVQFATRTSIRDAASTETVTLTVFDVEQARHLERYLLRTGYCRPRLLPVDLGFARSERKLGKAGRPKAILTPAQAAAKSEQKREQARMRKQAQRKREAANKSA